MTARRPSKVRTDAGAPRDGGGGEVGRAAAEARAAPRDWNAVGCRALLALVVLAPLPFGSARPWAWSLLALLVGMLLAGWALLVLLGRAEAPVPLRLLWAPAALYGLAVAWAILQGTGVVPESWHHPLWREAGAALDRTITGAVSLDPFETFGAVMRLLAYGGAFWLALQLCRDPGRAGLVLVATVAASGLWAAYGLAAHLSGIERVLWFEKWAYLGDLTGPFVNPGSFGAYAGLGLVGAAALLVRALYARTRPGMDRRRFARTVLENLTRTGYIYLIATAILATALFLSHSRGALLSTAGGLLVLLALLGGGRKINRPHALAAGAVVVAFVVVAPLFGAGGDAGREVRHPTVESRLELYRLTRGAVSDAPLLGVGLGNFEDAFRMYRPPSLEPRGLVYNSGHNIYLEGALELGVPAAAALVLALALAAWTCFRGVHTRQRDVIYPATGLAASVLLGVHGLVDFSIQVPAVALTYAVLLGMGCAQSWSTRTSLPGRGPPTRPARTRSGGGALTGERRA